MENANQRIVIETDSPNVDSILKSTDRIREQLRFLETSGSSLAKKDALLFREMLDGDKPGFEGLFVFDKNPALHSGMLETVTLVPLGESSWGIVADSSQITNSTDNELAVALVDESEHSRQRLKELNDTGKLSSSSKELYKEREIDATLHVINVVEELESSGFNHPEYSLLVQLFRARRSKMELAQKSKEEIEFSLRQIVEEYLIRKGYKF